jgi:hypothetical protein
MNTKPPNPAVERDAPPALRAYARAPHRERLGGMRTIVLALLLVMPGLAAAEVSDKMPTIPAILIQGAVVGTVLFALCRFRWWFVALGIPIAVWFVAGTVALWLEAPMRQALLQEQGGIYFISAAIADVLVVAGTVGGALLGWRRRHAAQQRLAADAPQAARR